MKSKMQTSKDLFSLQEEKLKESMAEMKGCFERGKKLLEEDMAQMGRRVEKGRRRIVIQRNYELAQKELEFEDTFSSDESLDKNQESPRKEHVIAESNFGGGESPNETARKFKMGLCGVVLKDNGEPLELTDSGKWDDRYDSSNSLVLSLLPNRTILTSCSTHNIILHTSMQGTPRNEMY
eukprot:TRINITY_DN7276_c0_g1_i10.p1 TRINITY_DN7276_c0_g1~~TRINITY_DN7276_c0_g1_i10.p1  ORF type:complete len:180 (-),score=29.45 TRINITY_DN7276_c0_g1_i10:239-778(-)